jgi:hypothetical protein
MAPAQTIEPADEVYRIYGNVMHLVQTWESAVVLLWWRAGIPEGGSGEAEAERSASAVDRLERAITRVTAGQARRELGGELPTEIADSVANLIPDRNRLAHRFLREQQVDAGFAPGTLEWLGDAGARFDACIRALIRHMERSVRTRASYDRTGLSWPTRSPTGSSEASRSISIACFGKAGPTDDAAKAKASSRIFGISRTPRGRSMMSAGKRGTRGSAASQRRRPVRR